MFLLLSASMKMQALTLLRTNRICNAPLLLVNVVTFEPALHAFWQAMKGNMDMLAHAANIMAVGRKTVIVQPDATQQVGRSCCHWQNDEGVCNCDL